jgi:hypothetical protein
MIIAVLMIAALTALVFWLAVEAGIAIARGLRSKSWPSTEGEILMAEVRAKVTGRGGKAWVPSVTYRFYVQGKEIVGHTIRIGVGERTFSSSAHRMIENYVVGGTHAVFYDPADPRVNVLEPGVSAMKVLCFVLTVGALIGGLAFAAISMD